MMSEIDWTGIPDDIQDTVCSSGAQSVDFLEIAKLLMAERERCARIAENHDAWPQEGADIAAAIRSVRS